MLAELAKFNWPLIVRWHGKSGCKRAVSLAAAFLLDCLGARNSITYRNCSWVVTSQRGRVVGSVGLRKCCAVTWWMVSLNLSSAVNISEIFQSKIGSKLETLLCSPVIVMILKKSLPQQSSVCPSFFACDLTPTINCTTLGIPVVQINHTSCFSLPRASWNSISLVKYLSR